MKKCSKPDCDTAPELQEFSKKAGTKDGLQSWCRSCCSKEARRQYEKNRDERLRLAEEYRKTNVEAVAEAKKRWHEANRDRLIESMKSRYEDNKEAHTEQTAAWRLANPEKVRTYSANANAKRRANVGKQKLPVGHMEAMRNWYGNQCMYPGCDDIVVTFDHVEPLSISRDHSLKNGQLLCKPHNSSKNARHNTDYRDHSKGILVDTFGR